MSTSSLFATIFLFLMVATQTLAVTHPFISHNNTTLASSPTKTAESVSARININTVDEATLVDELKGIGIKRAKAIIAYRDVHGPFKSIDDLIKIKEISKRIVDLNREKITV
ncbi:ComEA family DNA-binding protein [Rickettsiella grylli]|uniref:Competence protein ComEA helix-hairpin-helix region n=1 Tax=Rickettsiella grylli TaxID=59196 RepID=A8PQE3_9COXI|nr:helix-hairpin-helix domain-containing protein [Rickettsiella grylli]EDP46737.1 competence protein ComEA helix-hairpin-helix region [Rickettsiella grylli]OJA00412.1 hypothetical protein BEV13_03740 [Rickettsiella grylli]